MSSPGSGPFSGVELPQSKSFKRIIHHIKISMKVAKKIVAMRKSGRTNREVADELHLAAGKVNRVWELCLPLGVLNKKKRGRPKKHDKVR